MAGIRFTLVHQSAAPVQAPAHPTRDQVREEVRQLARDAQRMARDAQQAAQDARAARNTRVVTDGVPAVIPVPPTPPMPPGYTLHPGFDASNVIPPQAVDIAIGFFVMCAVMVVGWPIARAFGRRLERRGEMATIPPAMTDQLQRIEQAVEAMAIEVERISESQRFMAKLQSAAAIPERMALPHERG
jgi:HAMP domain-containing protein